MTSTDDVLAGAIETRLIDHHCHGVSPAELDFAGFQALFSESYRPAPKGTTEFQKPLGLAIRRFCAPVLDLEPSSSAEAYLERRLTLGAAEVNRRFLRASGLDSLLIDTGHRSDAILDVPAMAEAASRPAREVVRIEAVAEGVARTTRDAARFPEVLADRLTERAHEAVGLKTIVAYRCTFRIDQTAPTRDEVVRAADTWFRKAEASGKWRLEDPTVVRHGLWIGAELCRARKLPLQVHVGFGDPDIYLHACDPTHFTDFIAAMEKWEVPITLLHNYPFQREAAWLSEVFQNVYYDVGVILNYAAPMSADILGEALEIGKFSKLLYSSDAFGLSELYYLGALLFRRGLKRVLDRWLSEDFCTLQDAEELVRLVATENARRIYPLGELGDTASPTMTTISKVTPL
ncbi:MAG TPA: amidohydrolase family protein [Candidatus Cybelea sp.]|nr:amidohydrolase family protein [Candidatus Cybelea sp.]